MVQSIETTQAQAVAKVLWRYVAYSFQSDGIPNAEIAFRYAAYTYSVLDLLEEHNIALTTRYQFAETFAAADNRATDDPLVKNLQAVVNRTIAALWEGSYQAQTQQGAYSILSEKAHILGPQEASTFQVTEADTSCFLRDVQHLRYEVKKLLSQPVEVPPPVTATQPERPAKNPKEPHILCKIAKIISCFIVAFSLPFPIWSGVLFLVLFWKKPKTIYVGWFIALLYVYSAFPWQVFAVYLAIVALIAVLNAAGKRLSARPPREPKPAKELSPAVVAAVLIIGLSLSAVLTVWMQQKEAAPQPTQEAPAAAQKANVTAYKSPEGEVKCPVTVLVDGKEAKYRYIVFTAPGSLNPVAAYLTEDDPTLTAALPLGQYDLYLATGPKWYGVKTITGPEGEYTKYGNVLSLWQQKEETTLTVAPKSPTATPITAENFPQVTIGSSSTIVNIQTTK